MKTALTIAGSDPSGGAGIQADLKAFAHLRVHGMSVLTAITAQNTTGVTAVQILPPTLIQAQIDAVAADFPLHAAKTGMLADVPTLQAVADRIAKLQQEKRLAHYVCDPVVFAKSGARLLAPAAITALRTTLLPLATLVTPNLREAALLANTDFRDLDSLAAARHAAKAIHAVGPAAVLIKGIRDGDTMVDLAYDGHAFTDLPSPYLPTTATHGSGCTYSALLTALLALDHPLPQALAHARNMIAQAIAHAVPHGQGCRPVNVLAATPPQPNSPTAE